METRIYRTRINGDENTWALGRIAGAMDIICKNNPEENKGYPAYSIVEYDDNDSIVQTCSTTLTVETDQDRYDRFAALIKAWFPRFDIDFDVKA